MVADTIQTNIAVFLYTVFLFSCSETVIIQESDLIDGVTVQQFIRDSQYTGIIEIYYPNNQLKSLREYSGGKKYGKHKGWWENGNQQYEYYFDNDQNIGKHIFRFNVISRDIPESTFHSNIFFQGKADRAIGYAPYMLSANKLEMGGIEWMYNYKSYYIRLFYSEVASLEQFHNDFNLLQKYEINPDCYLIHNC